MIAIPSILARNGLSIGTGVIIGALMAWGPASCVAENRATAASAAKVQAASAKVKQAASQAELAATLAEMTRMAKTKQEVAELQEIVDHAEPGSDAGPAVGALLRRLREQRAAR